MKMKARRAVLWLLAAMLVVSLGLSGCTFQKDRTAEGGETESRKPEEDAENQTQGTSGETEKIDFPYELEDGRLMVNSLFQSEVANPDCQDEMGEETATLEIVNQSEEFLVSADITVIMPDGTKIPFQVTNLPAGKKAWVFAADNAAAEQEAVCSSIECDAVFEETSSLMEGQVSFEVQDTRIILKNCTEEELTNLSIACHCVFDAVYFGGLTYSYPVEAIPAGESVTVEANDCYLGSVDVVRITQGE